MAAKTLVTTFDDVQEAERAVQKLQADGFDPEGIGWVVHAPDGREIAHGSLLEERQRTDSAAQRTAAGGVLGGLAGLLSGVTAFTIAGFVGPVLIAGAVVGAVAGIGVGAVLGKRVDAIASVPVDLAVPEAHRYAARLGTNEAALVVRVDNEQEEARALEIIRSEASRHKHDFAFRIPALADEGRASRFSLS
jgi:hypothetical protein